MSYQTKVQAYVTPAAFRAQNKLAYGGDDKLLADILFWQEVKSQSDKQLKALWLQAQKADLIDKDDDIKASNAAGEFVALDSKRFNITCKLSEPVTRFSEDAFLYLMTTRFKLKESAAAEALVACKHPGSPSLSKRVVEK